MIRTEENILWSFAPHDISVMLSPAGRGARRGGLPGRQLPQPGVVDVTLSTLPFASGVRGHIFVSWLHPFKEQKLVVVGAEQDGRVRRHGRGASSLLYPHRVDWTGRVPNAVKAEAEAVAARPRPSRWRQECRHFLECVATRQRPADRRAQGLRVLRVLDACQQSLEHGGARCALAAAPSRAGPSGATSPTRPPTSTTGCDDRRGDQDLALLATS